MASACGYPIYVSISAGIDDPTDFTITLDGNEIYTGRVYSLDGSAMNVDISDICAQYLDPKYEKLNLGGSISVSVEDSVKTFAVSPGGSFTVCYNYNTDYKLDIPSGSSLNFPATDFVDPRQMIGSSTLGVSGINLSQAKPSGSVGATITVGGYQYKILRECPNRYAIYYVNKYGGLDYLICNARCTDRFSTDRTNARLYNDGTDRLSFENTRVYQDIIKQYTLNTGWISEERALNIDHLIFSPKAFIHDLENDTVTACFVDDTSITLKRHRADGMINYEFNVSESQLYKRR